MPRPLISFPPFILIAHLSLFFFFPFLFVSALVQNVTVDALGNTDHADFQTNGSPQYLPATQDWTFTTTGRSNDAQALSVRTNVQNATLVLTTAQPTTAFFWRGYLPGTAARYSVCIDCSSVDELGDIITLTSEDTTTDGNRSSPVILFASKALTNTTHTVALRNLRNTIDGVVGQLIVDAFIFTADVSSQTTGSGSDNDGTKTSRALMAGIVAIAVILGLCLIFAALFWLLWRRRGGVRGMKRSKSKSILLPPTIPIHYSVSPASPSGGSGGSIGGGGGGDRTSDPLVAPPSSRSFLGIGVARVGTTFTSVGRSVVALVPVSKAIWKRMGKGRKRGESESSPMIERERERDWEPGTRETKPNVVELELPIHAKLAQAHRSLSLSRFRATAPRFPPPPPPPKLKLKEGSISPNPDLAEAVAATTTNSTSSFSRFAGSLYWKKGRQSTGGKSRRNSMVSTSSVTIPPPPPPPFPIKATNNNNLNRTTPPPPLPFITVTSPTTVPTSASTYSTFSLSQTTHDLSRRSDPYAAYAAIYAPYYATGMENEGGEEGEDGRRGGPGGFRRKSNKRSSTVASAVAVAAAAGVVDDSSISQLSQKYRSGSALRDSVVLPGLLEMPGQPRQEREREQEREQEQEDRALVSTNSRPRPHLPPTSTSTSLRSNSSSRPSGPLPPPPSSSSTTAFSNNLASSSSARAPPSSFNSRVLRMGVQQGQELDGGNEGGDDDGDEGNRAGVKGKRTLSDKIKRGTLPLIPLHFGGGDQQQQQQHEDEEDEKKKKKKRDSFSGSSKRSSTSSILSFASRNSSSVSLVSKRLSTTKNNNSSSATTSKRRSSVLRKRRPPSLRGGSKESVDTTSNGNGNENDRDGDDNDDGDEKMVISLMPTFSSRSSLSLSSHLLLDGGMSHGGQRRHPTTAQSQFQRRNHSNPTLVSTAISLTQSRSEPLPSDVPSRQQERSRLNNEEVTSPPSTDSASLLPTNLSLQSPPLLVNGDASSSLLPKETTSPSSHLPEGIISPLSPPTDEKMDRNERDEILPYLAEDIRLPVEEEAQSEPLQRQSMATSQNHSHSSVFMSMLTLQSTDSSNNQSDSHLRGTHSANTRISMKTPRSSLVSKTARSSMMSNGPTPSVSEFPMPPFLTADPASMPSFDLYRSNTVNTTQSHRTSGGMTTNSNNMDAMSGEGLTGSGTATGTLTDLVVSTPSSSSGSFRKSIPIRLAGATGGASSSSIGVTPPSAFPFAYRPPPRPKRNRALGAALLGLDVPASVQSRAPIVRRNSSRSNKGMGISKAPRRRDNLPFRGGPIPTRAGRGSLSNDQENVSTGTSSTSFFIPPPPSSNDHGSHLEQPSRGPSRLTMTSAITSTTDEEYAHGEVQLLTARREYPPGIPDVPTRAIGPETEDSLSVHEQRPISGTTTDSKWEMMFPGLPPGMTPILTSGGSGSHPSGGPPNAAVPVSARTDAFERATVEMSPKSNRIDPALSRNPSIGTLSVGNMRLDATAGLPWSPNFDWPASPTFTNFSNRRPSLPFSSSGLLPTNVQETTARESEDKGKNSFPPFNNVAGASSKAPNMSSVPLQSLSWKDLMGPRSGPQVDPIDTANRPSVRQSTYSVASTFFGGEKSQADGTATPLDPSSPLVIPPVPPLPTRFSRSSAMIDSSPRRTVAPLNLNFKPSWNVRTLSPHSPSSSPQQPSTPQRAARAIGTLNDVFATSWNSGSTRYSSGPGATRILTPKTSEQESRSEQGTPVRSFPQRGVPFP